MEAFLDAIIVDEPGQSLANIASAFLLRRDAPEDSVRRTAEHAPLLARITQEIMADDHVAAKVGSVEDDPFGRFPAQRPTPFGLTRHFGVSWKSILSCRSISQPGPTAITSLTI
jgi:lysyl-tRNA synthetase class 1